MVTFIIVRHGYSKFNKEGRYTGQMDIPLDEIGMLQAKLNAKFVMQNYRIDAIYSSDLKRAMETARPVAEALHLPIHPEKDLREIDAGSWHGRIIAELKQKHGEEYYQWMAGTDNRESGDRESRAELRARSLAAFHRIAETEEGKNVLVVTHHGVITEIEREWIGPIWTGEKLPGIPNASVSVVWYDEKSRHGEFLLTGYDAYLEELGGTLIE